MLNFLGLMGGGMAQPSGAGDRVDTRANERRRLRSFRSTQMLRAIRLQEASRWADPVFDLTKLKWLNGEYLRALSPEQFFAALREDVFSDEYLRRIAPLVQTRIETLAQFGDMTDFFFKDDVMPPPEVFVPKKRTLEETVAFAAEQLAVLEATDVHDGRPGTCAEEAGRGKGVGGEGQLHAAARDRDGQDGEPAAAGDP